MNTPEQNLDVAISNWLEAVKVQVLTPAYADYLSDWMRGRDHGYLYTVLEPEDSPTSKFIRIVATHGGQRSMWAFVAKSDGNNKSLGNWRQGDIFYPASWKAPAKHAKGNIFENIPLCGIQSWHGPSTGARRF